MRLIATTILVLAVAGCSDRPSRATLAQEQLVQVRQMEASYDRELGSPSFAILAGKVDLKEAYRDRANPCPMIGQDRTPTEEERAALRRWAGLHERQLAKLEAVLMTVPDGSIALKDHVDQFYAVMDNGLRSQAVLISSLAEGRISYCQFAAQDKDLTEGVLREADALRSDVRRETGDFSLVHNWAFPNNIYGDNGKIK